MNASVLFADTAWESLFMSGAQVRVDAVFQRALTVATEESDDVYTVFFADGYHAPRAMTINIMPAPNLIMRGDRGDIQSGTLCLSGLVVQSRDCQFVDNYVKRSKPPLIRQVMFLKTWLKTHAREGSFYGAVTDDAVSQVLSAQLCAARQAFCEAMYDATPIRIGDATYQLMGLGIGLTPSGDDYLTGWLIVYTSLDISTDHIEALRLAVAKNIQRTTRVSRLYMRAALDGAYAEPVRDLCQAAATNIPAMIEAAKKVMSHGATSGQDIMTGMIDAWEQIIHERRGR